MRILLAEDDQRLGKLIVHMLERQDIAVDWVKSGDMAYEYAMYDAYDVAVLDWMMPIESGFDVCRRLRQNDYQRAILMLTARADIEDRVTALDAGADDYLIKPFEFSELLARLRALSRRSNIQIKTEIVEIGHFKLNRTNKTLLKESREIQLSPREFQLFDLLVQNIGIVVSREVILDRIWGLETEVSPNNVDSYIKLLRKKLDLEENSLMIHTIRGIGYKLEEQNDV